MKCKVCGGAGVIQGQAPGLVSGCPACDGNGFIEQTNEEWFCSLPTEEKARFFHGIVIRTMKATWNGKKPDYPAYLFDWEKWLKEKHHEM